MSINPDFLTDQELMSEYGIEPDDLPGFDHAAWAAEQTAMATAVDDDYDPETAHLEFPLTEEDERKAREFRETLTYSRKWNFDNSDET